MTITDNPTITPDECFAKAAEALSNDKAEIAREWRQLGEAISTAANTAFWQSGRRFLNNR